MSGTCCASVFKTDKAKIALTFKSFRRNAHTPSRRKTRSLDTSNNAKRIIKKRFLSAVLLLVLLMARSDKMSHPKRKEKQEP